MRVASIPTVLLSNAPFYDTTRGRVPADWFADLLGGHERGLPQRAKMLVRLLRQHRQRCRLRRLAGRDPAGLPATALLPGPGDR